MAKEKVAYQLYSDSEDFCEFCANYRANYDQFMNWQHHLVEQEVRQDCSVRTILGCQRLDSRQALQLL